MQVGNFHSAAQPQQLSTSLPRNKERLFAFGCSFTKYWWSTWCDVVADELQLPLWNFGRCGAGNSYIHYQVQQANQLYRFTERDLVMVMWSNVTRLDFFFKGQWHTPGNVYTQEVIPYACARQLADPDGMLLRDSALIQSTHDTLENTGCDYRMMSITDLAVNADIGGDSVSPVTENIRTLVGETFNTAFGHVYPAVDQTVWGCSMHDRAEDQPRVVQQTGYQDGHPYPTEHLQFLTQTFPDTGWSDLTVERVGEIESETTRLLERFGCKRVYTLSDQQTHLLRLQRLQPEQELRGLT